MNLSEKIFNKSTDGSGIVDISSINIPPDRMREDTPAVRRFIDEELAPSIAELGVIHPPVLNVTDGTFTLVTGWQRLQACIALGLTQIKYTNRNDLSEDEILELELEENLKRHAMTWQDEVLAIEKIHNQKKHKAQAKGEKWGLKQTGQVIGLASSGHISDALKIASHIKRGDKEIRSADNPKHALRILTGRAEDALVNSLAEHSVPKPKKQAPEMGPVRSSPGIDLKQAQATSSSLSESLPTGDAPEVDLSEIIYHMDNREWFEQAEKESIDVVYTDIPYGIDMDMLDYKAADLNRVEEAHDVEENVEQMEQFLKNCYRVLKDQRYLFFWYDIKHQEKLAQWGKDAGFDVLPYPLVWCKEHPCRNRAAGKWPTKTIEYCMVMAKGTATLRDKWTSCWITADGSHERGLQRNPFSKPFKVSRWILEKVVIAGDTMLDCYAGEGSLVRAGINMGLKVKAVEKDETHLPRLREHVKQVYSDMTRGKVEFK